MRATYSTEIQGDLIMLLDRGKSVTNDAEAVIADLADRGLLRGRRVICRDTTGRWEEFLHNGTCFTGFRVFERTRASTEFAAWTGERVLWFDPVDRWMALGLGQVA
jgi:hypothetical protein